MSQDKPKMTVVDNTQPAKIIDGNTMQPVVVEEPKYVPVNESGQDLGNTKNVVAKIESNTVVKTSEQTMAKPDAIAGFSESQIALIKRTVAKNATNDELAMFLHIAKKTQLDPFKKEIWFYKDKKGNTLIYAARDGYLTIAQRSGEFGGMKSGAVHENDEFVVDIASDAVEHRIVTPADRGKLVAAWATVYRKNCQPTTVYVENATYNKGSNTWATHPDAMLEKVAQNIALKKVFGITGVTSVEEKDSILEQPKETKALPKPRRVDWIAKLSEKAQSIVLNIEGTPNESLTTLDKISFYLRDVKEMPTKQKDAQQIFTRLVAALNQPA